MRRLVGLTGGIGSGKSTVAALLRTKGATVVDADQVARSVVEPGEPALAALVDLTFVAAAPALDGVGAGSTGRLAPAR